MSSSRAAHPVSAMTDVALIAVFAALIAAFALVPGIAVPGSSVPITLQTLAVALTAMILGPWRACLATLLYLVVGLAGLPVFANGAAGVAVLASPSVGYLLSFPLYALVVGALSYIPLRRGLRFAGLGLALAGVAGSLLVVHPMGIFGMMRVLHLSLGAAFRVDLVFWPGDIVKNIVAGFVAVAVHRAFPALSAPRVALAGAN